MEELEELLDEVACAKRLFPPRVWAVQIVSENVLDELIDEGILEVLGVLTGEPRAVRPYRFSPEAMLHPTQPIQPDTWRGQFLNDFRVFGLREAIVYLAQYDFTANPAPLFANAIRLYHAIARLYLSSEERIETSNDEIVVRLRKAMALYGEGRPQVLRGKAKRRKAR